MASISLVRGASARDGYKCFVKGALPRFRWPQRQAPSDAVQAQLVSKLGIVRSMRYISQGEVISLTSFFTVPKGEDEIRVVYDASLSGLNAAQWAPNFQLPTVDCLVRAVGANTWMGDLDIAKQFLNFPLDPTIKPYCGVDVSHYVSREPASEPNTPCMMGFKPSPRNCIKR